MAVVDQPDAQRFDEGGFAGSRNTRDADTNGAPGMGQQLGQNFLCALLMVDTRRLDQRDGFGKRAPLPGQNTVDQLLVVSR